MPITGISHLGLCVSDLDASLNFYRDILGFKLLGKVENGPMEGVGRLLQLDNLEMSLTFLERDGVRLELIHITNPRATGGGTQAFNRIGFTHLSVKSENFDEVLEDLRAANVEVLESTISSHPDTNARFAFFVDPDGNRIELFGKIDESGQNPWDFG